MHSLGPKDCFGEVALLSSDGKRNATITAATPGALVVLDKESYDSLLHMAHKRQTQTKLAFVHSLSLFDNVSKVSGGAWTSELNLPCFTPSTLVVPISPQARVLQLCRLLDLRKVPQGTVVCRRGEKCESMFFVVRGWVDEIKYFKIEETNKWATDLGRTQFVENTQARSVSAVVNQLGPKSCVPRALAPYDCRRGGSLLRLWSCVGVEQVLWAGVHAGEGSSVSEHDEMSQRVSLAPASPGRPDGTRIECDVKVQKLLLTCTSRAHRVPLMSTR